MLVVRIHSGNCFNEVEISPRAFGLASKFNMENDAHALAMINCGLHSGVKPCCVIFGTLLMIASDPDDDSKIQHAYFYSQRGHRCHSLCPACRLANVEAAQLLSCDCGIGHRETYIRFKS